MLRILRDAALVAALSVVVALGVNALRKDSLPLVQAREYEILVPCQEISGEVTLIDPADPRITDKTSLLIDARAKADFDRGHAPGAVHIPFDYLESTPPARIREVASSRAARVIVYGDGDNPDSGQELGKELSGKGIRNVHVVRGGAPALLPKAAP